MAGETNDRHRYFIEAAAKTLDVLETFSDNSEQLSITEIARRAKLPYTSAFRFLYTLEKRGYVMRLPGKRRYLLAPLRKRFRVGYAALGKIPMSGEVTRSIHAAARRFGLALLVADNEDSPSKALSNADQFFAEGIDLLVEFQRNDTVSHLIATKCHNAGVPAIAINFPQPGAYYFGADSYKTGWLAGSFLREFAEEQWPNEATTCLILPSRGPGSTQNTRKVGLVDALTQASPNEKQPEIEIAPLGVTAQEGYAIAKQFLRKWGRKSKHLLVAAFTDPLGVGVDRALKEAGLQGEAAIVGQGGTADARRHLRRKSALKGSVAYFPESYGERVLKLAITILDGGHPPLASFTDHVVLTASNLPDFYGDA